MKKEKLEKLIIEAREAYYNSDTPIMSDSEYDSLEEQLRDIDPENDLLSKTGIETKDGKTKLPFRMPSITKFDSKFLKNSNFFITDKHDGISVGLIWSNNKWKIYTRGDGDYGRDISHLSRYLRLPILKDKKVFVRAELQIKEENFSKYFKSEKDSRSTCAGLTNRKDGTASCKYIDVIAYQLVEKDLSPSQQISKLKKLGFTVPYYLKADNLSEDYLKDLFKIRKKQSEYILDGLVVSLDKYFPIPKEGNPKYSRKFKINIDNFKITEIERVVWQISRHTKLSPVLKIKPVIIKGVKISRLSGFNYKFILENKLGKGSIIKVSRSGDVIPDLRKEDIIKATQADLPKCKYVVKGVHAYTTEYSNDAKIKEITYFFKIIGVKHLSIGIVQRLYDNGYKTIKSILSAKIEDIEKIDGFKRTLSTKIVNGIEKSLNPIELPKLMHASNKFGEVLGYKRLKAITDTIVFKDESTYNSPAIKGEIGKIFKNSISKFHKFYDNIEKFVTLKEKEEKISKGNKMEGKVFCFTGFRDKDLEKEILSYGGKIVTSMSKKVTHLIVKDLNFSNKKTQYAKENKIPIYQVKDIKL